MSPGLELRAVDFTVAAENATITLGLSPSGAHLMHRYEPMFAGIDQEIEDTHEQIALLSRGLNGPGERSEDGMYKKDMIWIAVAKLLFPATSRTRLVTGEQIEREVLAIFGAQLTPIQFERHLVSWENKDKDRANPARGGDRSRYLFRTEDGVTPSHYGLYRLYKETDGQYDGVDKTGTTHPAADRVGGKYGFLVDWYEGTYFTSS